MTWADIDEVNIAQVIGKAGGIDHALVIRGLKIHNKNLLSTNKYKGLRPVTPFRQSAIWRNCAKLSNINIYLF